MTFFPATKIACLLLNVSLHLLQCMHLYFSILVMEKIFLFQFFRETATYFPVLTLFFQLYLQPTHLQQTDEDRKTDKRVNPVQAHQREVKETRVRWQDQSLQCHNQVHHLHHRLDHQEARLHFLQQACKGIKDQVSVAGKDQQRWN